MSRFSVRTVRLLVFLAALVGLPASVGVQAQTESRPASDDLTRPAADEWLTNGGSLSNTRFSTLTQIDPSNVTDLRGVWLSRLNSGRGTQFRLEGEPVVVDGVMYLSSAADDIFALEARTGRKLWVFNANLDPAISALCCGWTNRGVAVGAGLVFAGMLDGSLVALDQTTGAVAWKDDLETWQQGYSISSAPRYYDGLVFTGTSGGEFGARGRVYALDARTGKEVWRFYTVPDPADVGGDTWPTDGLVPRTGGDVSQTPAIDPDLGLVYFSTGSPAPQYDGSDRAGANLFTDSIVALDYRTGAYRWHFQEVHHDIWNYAATSPVVLFDAPAHKALYQCGRAGWCYFLDRATGQPLLGLDEHAVPQETRQATAATQPYPQGDAYIAQCGEPLPSVPTACLFDPFWDGQRNIRPGAATPAAWSPTAFDPRSGLVFIAAPDLNSVYVARPRALTPGQRSTGGTADPPAGSAFAWTLTAIQSSTNRIAWQRPGAGDTAYGVLATASGLIFAGQADGTLLAYDASTGKPLWHFQTGWGITAPPMSWAQDGVQYVTVMTGGNAASGPATTDGDAVWTFALTGGIDEARAPLPPQTNVGVAPYVEAPVPFVPISSMGG